LGVCFLKESEPACAGTEQQSTGIISLVSRPLFSYIFTICKKQIKCYQIADIFYILDYKFQIMQFFSY